MEVVGSGGINETMAHGLEALDVIYYLRKLSLGWLCISGVGLA